MCYVITDYSKAFNMSFIVTELEKHLLQKMAKIQDFFLLFSHNVENLKSFTLSKVALLSQ